MGMDEINAQLLSSLEQFIQQGDSLISTNSKAFDMLRDRKYICYNPNHIHAPSHAQDQPRYLLTSKGNELYCSLIDTKI